MQVLSKSGFSGNKSGSKNCQISEHLRQKVAQTLVNRGALTNIAQQSARSSSTVYRKLNQFVIKEDFSKLPEVLSWDGFSYQKGELAFIAQDFESKKNHLHTGQPATNNHSKSLL